MGTNSVLEEHRQLRESLLNDINKVERVLVDFETQYHTADYSQAGNVLRGFDNFLASKENMRKRARGYKPEDRLFSLSSRTCPAGQSRELDGPGIDIGDAVGGMSGGMKKVGQYAQKGYAQKGYAQKQPKR